MENGVGINDLSNYQEPDATVQQFDSLVNIFWLFFLLKPRSSGFLNFVITNFNKIVSTFRGWFWQIGIRSRVWRIGFPPVSCYCADHSQFSEALYFIK
jgi:hypothetical protein